MALSPSHLRQHIGRPVRIDCHDGARHFGIIRHVKREGIYVQRLPYGGAVSAQADELMVDHADGDGQPAVEGETVFFPLLFLPLLALAAVAPFAWGGGYGGYYW